MALGVATAAIIIVTSWFVADVVASRFEDEPLGGLALAIVGAFAVRAAISWGLSIVSERSGARVKRELRDELIDDLTDPRRLGPMPESARTLTLLGPGMDAFDGYVGRFLPQLALAVIVPPAVIVTIGLTDWISAAIIAVTLPLIGVFMWLVGVLTADRVERRWAAMERLGRHFGDVLDGIVVLKVFGRDQRAGIREVGEKHRTESIAALRLAFLSSLVLELLSTISVALVAVTMGLRVVEGIVDLQPAMFVLLLAPEAYLPVRKVGMLFHDSQEGATAVGELLDVLDHPTHTGRTPVPADLSIEIDELVVSHPDRSAASLTLGRERIETGEFVVITGPTGSGKSTLLSALLGQVVPDAGSVRIGGVDVLDLDIVQWRRRLAWVPQTPGVVGGTIAANVTLGLPDLSPNEVARALADAGAETLAPERVVGEAGADLSAGEKRRLAVARALVRVRHGGARIVLLDEPTAGLDARREAEVLTALRGLDATVVVVSHRPDTIRAADRVIDLAAVPA